MYKNAIRSVISAVSAVRLKLFHQISSHDSRKIPYIAYIGEIFPEDFFLGGKILLIASKHAQNTDVQIPQPPHFRPRVGKGWCSLLSAGVLSFGPVDDHIIGTAVA